MKWWQIKERISYKVEDMRILIFGMLSGIKFMLTVGGWQWIKQTKREEGFTWCSTIGMVLYGDYRRHKHYMRDWD